MHKYKYKPEIVFVQLIVTKNLQRFMDVFAAA